MPRSLEFDDPPDDSPGCEASTELVWNGGNTATAVNRSGQSLRIGDQWPPEALFSLGVELDLMTTFLQLAGEVSLPVLAYVSAGQLVETEDQGTRLTVSVCIVVDDSAAETCAAEIWQTTRHRARIGDMLGSRLTVEATILGAGPETRH